MNNLKDHPLDLLPWYVNGTLDGEELQQVESHLKGCERCRSEVAFLQSVRQEVKAAGEAATPGDLGLQRLLRTVRAERKATRWTPQWWQPALAAAALVVVIQATLLVNLWPEPESITPLGGPPSAGVVLQVRFVPTATEVQIREAIQDVNGTIIDGPSAVGIYRVELDLPPDAEDQQIEAVLAHLRAHQSVIQEVNRE
jgi:anti-sigma factor RsiW